MEVDTEYLMSLLEGLFLIGWFEGIIHLH